jgi:Lar family restriction alleviation protein
MSDLLPCPFCGGFAARVDIEEPGDNFGGACIACVRCGASGPVHFDRKENLEASWNERAPLPSCAARDVLAERARQVDEEGWTPEHDDQHEDAELARAAVVYARHAYSTPKMEYSADLAEILPEGWPWAGCYFRPQGPRRDLVKAGALILAEIERRDRTDARKST